MINRHHLKALRFLNRRRFLNLLGLYFLHFIGMYFRKVILRPPAFGSIELSSVCNLKCPQCVVGLGKINRKNAFVDQNLAQNFIDDFSRYGIVLNLYFQGESTLHPGFVELASYASSKQLYTILSTNGVEIDSLKAGEIIRAGVQKIIVSIDGFDDESYGKYRVGGEIKKAWRAVEYFSNAIKQNSSSAIVVVQTVVSKYNENQLGMVEERARSLGAHRVVFKSMQIVDDEACWSPENIKYRRVPNKNIRGCFRAYSGVVMTTDGDIIPCCFDKFAENRFNEDYSFFETVKGILRKCFLSKIYIKKEMHSICISCPKGRSVFLKKK